MKDWLENCLHIVLKPSHDLSRYEHWAAVVRKEEGLDFTSILWTEILCEMAAPPDPGQLYEFSFAKSVERRLK
jgi:hypothetical protein